MNNFFSPSNSENLVFIGAGATAALGMPSTANQTEFFRKLAGSEDELVIKNLLSEYFDESDCSKVSAFIKLLDNDDFYSIRSFDIKNAKILYGSNPVEEILIRRIYELRHEYDWNAAKKVIKICPEEKDENNDNLILDAYSIIDKHLISGQSLKLVQKCSEVKDCFVETILDTSRLQGARNFLIVFVNMLFSSAWYKITKGKKSEEFAVYKNFINSFDCLMQKEGMKRYQEGYKPENRDFYLFSTSFVSFNFEMVFPWLFMVSHHDMNHKSLYIKDHPLKLWLDYGVEHRGRKLDDVGNVVPTLEFTESVASRENEEDHIGTPLNRAGKFYFAHGSSNWRECPVCGRMTFYFGYSKEKWNYKSQELIPSFPFPIFSELKESTLTEQEIIWRINLRYDSLQCMHCGAETRAIDAPMIMQTMHKSTPTSFLEEIQRNVKVAISKAKHIVLLGYTLPTDDTIWVHAFAEGVRSRITKSEKVFCSVIVGYKGEEKWISGEELSSYIKLHKYKTNSAEYGISAIENAISIFGEENVRAWTGGIPQVFGRGTEVDVKKVFYYEGNFPPLA